MSAKDCPVIFSNKVGSTRHSVFHPLAHKRTALAVLADKERCADILARDHLRGMRGEYDLIAFAGKILERHAHEFHRLRVQIKFRGIDEEQRAAHIMIIVVALRLGEVTHKSHLNGALGARAHVLDVALKAVILVHHGEGRVVEKKLESRNGKVELHFHARKQGIQLFVHIAVKSVQFPGACRSPNFLMSSLNSLPTRRSSGRKISSISFVKARSPSKSQI